MTTHVDSTITHSFTKFISKKRKKKRFAVELLFNKAESQLGN